MERGSEVHDIKIDKRIEAVKNRGTSETASGDKKKSERDRERVRVVVMDGGSLENY